MEPDLKSAGGDLLRQPSGDFPARAEGLVLDDDVLDIPRAGTVFAPATTGWVFAGTPAGLFVSKDTGETWQPAHLVLQFTYNTRREIGGAAYVDAYWRARYYGFIDDTTAAAPWTE